MEYINPIYHDQPAYFEVGVLEEGKGLILSAHRKFAESLKPVTADPHRPLFTGFEQNLQVRPMVSYVSEQRGWGFGEVFTPLSEENDWVKWQCLFPEGRELFSTDSDWRARNELAASFRILTLMASTFQEKSDSNRNQLVQLDMTVTTDEYFNKAPISATLTPAFVRWLATQRPRISAPEVEKPMRTAYDRMSGWPTDESARFQCTYRAPHFVNLIIPGQDAGLDPKDYGANVDRNGAVLHEGYTLLDHNVDTIVQQMSLLTGIAAMHDLARRDGF